MSYFTRTEETMDDINNSFSRGRSINCWSSIGQNVWCHLYRSSNIVVKKIYYNVLNRDIDFLPPSQEDIEETYRLITDVYKVKHNCSKEEFISSFTDDFIYRFVHPIYKEINYHAFNKPYYKSDEIAKFLKLEKHGCGYIKYLDGLCALEKFENEPIFNDCTKMLIGDDKEPYLFNYLVCFEGYETGIDIGDDWGQVWTLFKPTRIVWIKETNFYCQRNKHK